MNASRSLVLVALAFVFVSPAFSQNAAPPAKEETGLAVGQQFPFHVADFVNGKYAGRGGCPSVMISNSRGRGVIIWTRDGGEAALALGHALEKGALKSERLKGFLVAFAGGDPKLAETAKAWTSLTAGNKRSGGETAFQTMKIADSTQVLVFFLDRKQIKQRWDFTAGELTTAKIAELNALAEKFAADLQESPAKP
jgi:hypothetical protein